MKIVILGSGGRLGAALARLYGQTDEVLGINHATLDLADAGSIQATLGSASFDVLVNCAALTNVDYCETHSEEAYRINALAAGEIAGICAAKSARCIHISTDYVFDGSQKRPYVEEDAAEPISIYGASKRAGEAAVIEASTDHLVVRVSWVFGPDRPSFIDLLLKRAFEQESVEAIDDKFSAPSYTIDLAACLRPFLSDIRYGGLLHLCNTGACTWREYGQHALDCAVASGLQPRAHHVGALRLDQMKNFVARRPVNTVLSTEKFTQLTGCTPRPWQEAVEEYVRSMKVEL